MAGRVLLVVVVVVVIAAPAATALGDGSSSFEWWTDEGCPSNEGTYVVGGGSLGPTCVALTGNLTGYAVTYIGAKVSLYNRPTCDGTPHTVFTSSVGKDCAPVGWAAVGIAAS